MKKVFQKLAELLTSTMTFYIPTHLAQISLQGLEGLTSSIGQSCSGIPLTFATLLLSGSAQAQPKNCFSFIPLENLIRLLERLFSQVQFACPVP